jgi:hypothetical protein
MCSRFEMHAPPRELTRRFGQKSPPDMSNTPELRPTDQVLVVDRADGIGQPGQSDLIR